jgi:hypothetical protein
MDETHLERTGSNTYRRTAMGFGLSAVGLVVLCADTSLELGYILSFAPELRKLLLNPIWRLGVGGAVTGLTFASSYLIWLRLDTTKWARCSTLLLLMNAAHVLLWLMENHGELGMPNQKFAHSWGRHQISQIMNWAEFACWIALIRQLKQHAGQRRFSSNVDRLSTPFPGFVALGFVVSIMIAIGLTDWSAWPLERVVWLGPLDSLMLATATTMLMLAASLQMTMACFRAARFCRSLADEAAGQELAEPAWTIDRFDEDPWGTRGEAADYPIW